MELDGKRSVVHECEKKRHDIILFQPGSLLMHRRPQSGEVAAFVRSDDEKLFPADSYKIKDESSGPNAPDIEVINVPLGYTEHGSGPIPPGSLVTMCAVILRYALIKIISKS